MRPWLNWIYVARALGVGTMGLGILWHDGALVITGLGVAFGPQVWNGGK